MNRPAPAGLTRLALHESRRGELLMNTAPSALNRYMLGEPSHLEKELTPGTGKRYVPRLWGGFDFLHWRG
jgi:hypothetical protein